MLGDAAPEVARDEAGESTATEESSLIDSIAPLGLMDVLVNRIPTPQGSISRSASDDQRVTNAYLVGDVEIYIHAHDRDGSSNVSGHATGHGGNVPGEQSTFKLSPHRKFITESALQTLPKLGDSVASSYMLCKVLCLFPLERGSESQEVAHDRDIDAHCRKNPD